MPTGERSPIGISFLQRLVYFSRRGIETDIIEYEEDTKPLESVSVYSELLSKLKYIQLRLQNYHDPSEVAWEDFGSSEFRTSLGNDLMEFLEIRKSEPGDLLIKLSVSSEDEQNPWVALDNENRKIIFEFSEVERGVSGKLQTRGSDKWIDGEVIKRDVRPDAHRVLEVATNLVS